MQFALHNTAHLGLFNQRYTSDLINKIDQTDESGEDPRGSESDTFKRHDIQIVSVCLPLVVISPFCYETAIKLYEISTEKSS